MGYLDYLVKTQRPFPLPLLSQRGQHQPGRFCFGAVTLFFGFRGLTLSTHKSALLLGQFTTTLITQIGLPATFAAAGAATLLIAIIFAVASFKQKAALEPSGWE